MSAAGAIVVRCKSNDLIPKILDIILNTVSSIFGIFMLQTNWEQRASLRTTNDPDNAFFSSVSTMMRVISESHDKHLCHGLECFVSDAVMDGSYVN